MAATWGATTPLVQEHIRGQGAPPICLVNAAVMTYALDPSAGVKDEHCQEVYQPAAAAELRFLQGLAKQHGLDNFVKEAPPTEAGERSGQVGSRPFSCEVDGVWEMEDSSVKLLQVQSVDRTPSISEEARKALKDQLDAEQASRVKELVDAAWQSLE